MKTRTKLYSAFLAFLFVMMFAFTFANKQVVQAQTTVPFFLNAGFYDKSTNPEFWAPVVGVTAEVENVDTGEIAFTATMTGTDNSTYPRTELPYGKYVTRITDYPEDHPRLVGKYFVLKEVEFEVTSSSSSVSTGPYILIPKQQNVSLNTQFMDLDRNFSRIPNAISVAKNTATGEEFTFTMGADGTIPHLQLPLGDYEVDVASVPASEAPIFGRGYVLPNPEIMSVTEGGAHGWTITVTELAEPAVKTQDVSLNTQFMDLGRQFSRIPNAVSFAKNKATGEEFTFTMGADGAIPHVRLPIGDYEVRVASVPANDAPISGKAYELPDPVSYTVEEGKNYGWTITVTEKIRWRNLLQVLQNRPKDPQNRL